VTELKLPNRPHDIRDSDIMVRAKPSFLTKHPVRKRGESNLLGEPGDPAQAKAME
jgi:hypothetical protein